MRRSSALVDEPVGTTVEFHSTFEVRCEPFGRGVSIPVSGSHAIRVLLETLSGEAVVLRRGRAVVLTRRDARPPLATASILSMLPMRPFIVDLDPAVPRITARDIDFPFEIRPDDPEILVFEPHATEYETDWRLELDWTCTGRRGTIRIPHRGAFCLYPRRLDLLLAK